MATVNKKQFKMLSNGAYASMNEGGIFPSFNEKQAYRIMLAKGSTVIDRKPMVIEDNKDRKTYVSVITTTNGETCWINFPVESPIGWNANGGYILTSEVSSTISEEEYAKLDFN